MVWELSLISIVLFVVILILIIISLFFRFIYKSFRQFESRLDSITASDVFVRIDPKIIDKRIDEKKSSEELKRINVQSVDNKSIKPTISGTTDDSNESKSIERVYDSLRNNVFKPISHRFKPKSESIGRKSVAKQSVEGLKPMAHSKSERVVEVNRNEELIEGLNDRIREQRIAMELKNIPMRTDSNLFGDTIVKMDSIIDQTFDSMIESIDSMNRQTLQYTYSSDEE